MTCFHPKKGFVKGLKANGTQDIEFCSYDVKWISWFDSPLNGSLDSSGNDISPRVFKHYDDLDSHTYLDKHPDYRYTSDYVLLPCGRCTGCKIDQSRDWANRMTLESYQTELHGRGYCYFITLTYNELYLPMVPYDFIDDDGSHKLGVSKTLSKKDLVNFMKRLRKKYGEGIRFFACGEYGSKTRRPHYHLIIFNLVLDGLEPINHSPLYSRCDSFDKLWPYGFHVIAPFSWETAAYVSRYVTKKIGPVDKSIYEKYKIQPEFATMSRRPGIGREWFDEHKKDLDSTYIIRIKTKNGVREVSPPAYFDNLYKAYNPDRFAEIKENRKSIAEEQTRLKLMATDKDYLEMLKAEELNFLHSIGKLRRDLEV